MKRVWIMKDGEKVKIRDMETSHIQNCIKMVENELDDLAENGFYDLAQEYIDSFQFELAKRLTHK